MNVILNSGYVVKNVQLQDKTKSPVGLFVWATNQAKDQVLTFDKLSIKCSQIAGIELADGEYYPNNKQQNQHQQHIGVRDEDLPWNNNQNQGGNY